MKNNTSGITLISLIITLIVFTVIAGVSIRLITGEEGVVRKSVEAGEQYKKSSEKEMIEFSVASAKGQGEGIITTDNLNKELKRNFENED